MGTYRTIKTILIKDLLQQSRCGQVLPVAIALGIITSLVFRLSLGFSAIEPTIISAVILLNIIFAIVISSEKLFFYEDQHSCIDGLVLACDCLSDIYIAKFFANIFNLCLVEFFTIGVTFLLFNVALSSISLSFIGIIILINVSVSAVSTLLGSLLMSVHRNSSLLVVLIFAIIAPVLIPSSTAITASLFPSSDISHDVTSSIYMIASYGIIYGSVGWLLFKHTVIQD